MAPGDEWLDRLIDGRFRVREWLSGDEGSTLLSCVQVGVGRPVTLRLVRPERWEAYGAALPFDVIARQHATVQSTHLAPIHDVGLARAEARYFVVSDPLAGQSVRELISHGVTSADALAIARGVLVGLRALHDAGIVHGSVRPEHVWVEGSHATLLDGLGREGSGAPEGTVDARSDLFGVGVMLRDMTPIGGSPALAAFVQRCAATDPAARFASAADALEALDAVAQAAPDAATVVVAGQHFDDGAALPSAGLHAHVDVSEEARVRQLVVAALAALGKAFRSYAIYPENNPMLAQSADEVCRHLDTFFERYDRLDLWVDRFALRFKKARVYEDADVRGSLPFRLHTDGIRRLSFCAGLAREEMHDYLACLQHAAGPGSPTFDLVTVMWEKRFPHIFCRMVEDLVPPAREELTGLLGTDEVGSAWYGVEAVHRPPPPPDFSGHRAVPVEAQLSREDVAALAEMMRDEAQAGDDLQYVVHLLAALALCAGTPDQDVLKQSLSEALRGLYDRGNVVALHQSVLALREVLAHAPSEDVRVDLTALLLDVSGAREVGRLLEAFRSSGDRDEVVRIAQLLAELEPAVVEPIVEQLDAVPPDRVPHLQMTLLIHCEKRPWLLTSGVRSARPAIARAVIRVLRQISGPRAANELHAALAHDATAVRIDALRALASRHDERLAERLPWLLRDVSDEVRSAALASCGDLGPTAAAGVLSPVLSDPDLRKRPRDEQTTLFRVAAQACGDAISGPLAALVQDPAEETLRDRLRDIIRPSDKDHLFELAVRALLQIDGPGARAALETARRSRSRRRRKLAERLCAVHDRRTP